MDNNENNVVLFKRHWKGQKMWIDTHLDNLAHQLGGEDRLIDLLKVRFNLTEKDGQSTDSTDDILRYGF